MYLQRPAFRLWPLIAAVSLSYPIAGAIWAIPVAIEIYVKSKDLFATFMAPVLSAYLTTGELGFPHLREGSDQTNEYPVILPVMAVLLVIASGLIRRGQRPRG